MEYLKKGGLLMTKLSAAVLCSALFFGFTPAALAAETAVTVIHTTDAHGRSGGYAAVAALVQKYEAAGENVLLLDSGDIFHGLPQANLERGGSIASVMSKVGYDAVTTGNHDYNYGADRLKELGGMSGAQILAANVKDEAGEPVFGEYKIWDFDGFKVAVFGLANDNTKTKTAPSNTEGIIFEDDIETAEKIVGFLEDKADYIIALTHIGSETESEGTSIELAEKVDGIDLILDGHSHNTNDGIEVGDTMLVSGGCYQESADVVTVLNDGTEKFERYFITKDSPEDEEIKKYAEEIEKVQEELLLEKVGKTDVFLNAEYPIVRTGETYFGDLICDAYRAQTGAQIAVENGGGIRASIPAGDITKGQVYQAFPFGNYIVTKSVSGADFVQILEDSVAEVAEIGGSFLQISGAGYTYDSSAEPGKRVSDVTVDGEPIELEKEYIVATNNYVGEKFSKFAESPTLNEYGASDEALIAYLAEHGVEFEDETPRIVQTGRGNEYVVCIEAYVAQSDVAPVVGEKLMLPYRAVLEQAGYSVSWDETAACAAAEKGESKITVCTDGEVSVNGKSFECDIDVISGRILIESSAIEAVTEKAIYTDEKTKSVLILK